MGTWGPHFHGNRQDFHFASGYRYTFCYLTAWSVIGPLYLTVHVSSSGNSEYALLEKTCINEVPMNLVERLPQLKLLKFLISLIIIQSIETKTPPCLNKQTNKQKITSLITIIAMSTKQNFHACEEQNERLLHCNWLQAFQLFMQVSLATFFSMLWPPFPSKAFL